MLGVVLQRLVDKLHWVSNEVYAELFALAQCVPGPASTQVSFALGIIKKGVTGEQYCKPGLADCNIYLFVGKS